MVGLAWAVGQLKEGIITVYSIHCINTAVTLVGVFGSVHDTSRKEGTRLRVQPHFYHVTSKNGMTFSEMPEA